VSEAQDDRQVREGDILAGKYRVEQVLGQGGMGVVVAATHTVLQNRVALKFLLPSVAKHQQTTTRFLREAQSAVKIKSPHVARVIDVGQMEDSGSPYMVMEYLEGKDLGAILETEGALDVERTCLLVLQTCEALAAAHAAGIVHRDIKPSNLFITPGPDGQPMVKVLDFGISKNVLDMGISKLTQTQTSMGSPLYMSPEQMRSARDVDARTDIWSLGVVLFEALTGQTPFLADTMPQLVALVLEEKPPKVDSFRSGLPPELVEAVARCLQKDRTLRYPHVGMLADALAPYVPHGGALSAERANRIIAGAGLDRTVEVLPTLSTGQQQTVKASATPSKMSGTATSFGRTGSGGSVAGRRVSPGLLIGAGAGVVALGVLGVVLLGGPSESESPAAATTAAVGPAAVEAPLVTQVAPTPPPPDTAEIAPSSGAVAAASQAGEVPATEVRPPAKGSKPGKPVGKKAKEDPFGDRF
jgi:serine/threonine protein kinase